jgi:hypothetical protein
MPHRQMSHRRRAFVARSFAPCAGRLGLSRIPRFPSRLVPFFGFFATWHGVAPCEVAMTDNTNNPTPAPSSERKLLRWILVLQVVILAWLAKNLLTGHSTADSTTHCGRNPTDTPPSLEPSAQRMPRHLFRSCRGSRSSPPRAGPDLSPSRRSHARRMERMMPRPTTRSPISTPSSARRSLLGALRLRRP